ncbi:hypothetical protein J3459_010155 [Metarhizium acridum]|nr:hypothetical protein J3459_010155 [Metarhizium acridum]
MTPWSGMSRAYSPTTSLTNVSTTFSGPSHHFPLPSSSSVSTGRPGTSASSNETIFQQRAEDEKSRFLNELRQTLTSLLLSDLGSQVLARGSETDAWFHGLGQQFIDRKDALDHARRRPERKDKEVGGRSSTRPRVIEKKKSFRNLRNAGDSVSERSADVPLVAWQMKQAPPGLETGANQRGYNRLSLQKAYHRLLNMFSVNPNPFAKLNALNELENLITASLMWHGSKKLRANRSDAGSSTSSDRGPNNRQTPLDGTIDNVKERRSQAIQSVFHPAGYGNQPRQANAETKSISSGSSSTDAITSELQRLFRDAGIRPKSLFRDLQLIAAFVPSTILDKPERGKAFWNVGLAALKLKSEVCRTMVEIADNVIEVHTRPRNPVNDGHILSESKPSVTGTPPPPPTIYNLHDAGKMCVITAREGYPAAQRELALLYMSNPECVERTTLPLSKPREVFKQAVMERYGRSERTRGSYGAAGPAGLANASMNTRAMGPANSAGDGPALGGKDSDARNDVGLLCIAIHWMEAAEQGGDDLAARFLRQNDFTEMG